MRLPAVQRLVGDPAAHFEVARGSRSDCRDYCRKSASRVSDPVEFGNFTGGGQGRRTDIDDALDVVRAGGPGLYNALYDSHGSVMVKYTRGMANAINHYIGRRTREGCPTVLVHYGDTGSGKTRYVYDTHDLLDLWRAPVSTSDTAWFDGYLGQSVALLDDFDGHHPALTVMLQVLDRYPLQVPVKGSHAHWLPQTIYITTNVPFRDWYPSSSQAHKAALRRRITRFVHFRSPLMEATVSDNEEF